MKMKLYDSEKKELGVRDVDHLEIDTFPILDTQYHSIPRVGEGIVIRVSKSSMSEYKERHYQVTEINYMYNYDTVNIGVKEIE